MRILFRQIRCQPLWTMGPVVMIGLCLLSLLAGQAHGAVSIDSLYEIRVPVADQSSARRQVAFQTAFDGTLKKLTGNSNVTHVPGVANARQQVARFVRQFNYWELSEAERVQFGQNYLLQVHFSETLLNQVLRDNKLPIWGDDRPQVLVWMAQEQDGQRVMVAPHEQSVERDSITASAKSLGIPVIYPLLDFEDNGELSVSELWGLFDEPILRASKRYRTKAILALTTWPTGGGRWSGRSLFMLADQVSTGNYTGATIAELTEAVMADIARKMSGLYAVVAGVAPERPVRIQVDNINNVSAYASLMQYMDDLSAVRNITPVRVSGSRVLLDVTIDGTLQQLGSAIELGRNLKRTQPSEHTTGFDEGESFWQPVLQYSWR